MKNLRSVSVVEHNVPGVLVSIMIPSLDIVKFHNERTIIDINCKTFFSKVISSGESKNEINSSNDPLLPPNLLPPRVSNRYDNIIDQLERKYYCESMIQSKASTNAEDSSDEDDADEMEQLKEMTVETSVDNLQGVKRSRKSKVFSDDYDMEDPFIDDEEMINEVEASMKTKRTKTKHDGFFVSKGNLEVLSPSKQQRATSSNVPRVKTTSSKTTKPTIDTIAISAAPPALPLDDKGSAEEPKAKRKRRKKAEMAAALALAVANGTAGTVKPPKTSATAPAGTGNTAAPLIASPSSVHAMPDASISKLSSISTGAASGGVTGATTSTTAPSMSEPLAATGAVVAVIPVVAAKPAVEKPAWIPGAGAAASMEAFREYFKKTGIKLSKSSNIPKVLEEPLHALDGVVLQAHSPADLLRTSGYYEGLSGILGTELPVGKIRSLLSRLRLKDKANSVYMALQFTIQSLQKDLKMNTIACPDTMQPGYRAAKRSLVQASSPGPGPGLGPVAADGIPQASVGGVAAVWAEAATLSVAAGADGGKDRSNRSASSESPMVGGSPVRGRASASRSPATALGTVGSPFDKPLSSTSALVPVSAPSPSQASSSAPVVVATVYAWMCKWSHDSKHTLCAVENEVREWVVQENLYRDKLTVFDRKYMEDKDSALLDENDTITKCFTNICAIFPESCLHGDVNYLRKIIAGEKNKLKRKEKKEQTTTEPQQTEVISRPTVSSVPVTVVTEPGSQS